MDEGTGAKDVHGGIARLPRVLSDERGFTLIELLVVMALLMVALAMLAFAAPQLPLPGQTERGPDNAKSLCSYSGPNDFEEGPGPLTQNYGQDVKLGSEVPREGAAPGFACNPTNIPLK